MSLMHLMFNGFEKQCIVCKKGLRYFSNIWVAVPLSTPTELLDGANLIGIGLIMMDIFQWIGSLRRTSPMPLTTVSAFMLSTW